MPRLDTTLEAPVRPAFRDGQVLRAADLQGEAESNVQAARRHQKFAHLPGIVAGLWLGSESGEWMVSPGMAIDGAGRTIFVGGEAPILFPEYMELPRSLEVWIAYRESRAQTCVRDEYEIVFEPRGRYDPRRPAEHPRQAIFLGTLNNSEANADPTGRVYIGAVGARIESASGRTRVLLAPEDPADLRRFAIGTRLTNPGTYRDALTAETSGTIRFNDPVRVGTPNERSPLATIIVACRAAEFRAQDILDPDELRHRLTSAFGETKLGKLILSGFDEELLRQAEHRRLRRLLTGLLNQRIRAASIDGGDSLKSAVEGAKVSLRPETVRLKLYQTANSPRADGVRFARLLLEDAFPNELARLVDDPDAGRGAVFVGTRAEPQAALPGRVYLTAMTEKGVPRRELRVEIMHPGKDNNPERYQAVVGTVAPNNGGTGFEPCMIADASGTVTILGDLRVYTLQQKPGEFGRGLILKVKPAPAPGEAVPPGGAFGAVAPWDLVIDKPTAALTTDKKAITITSGNLVNSGGAPITDVQVHAVVFPKDDTSKEPVRETLVRNLVVRPSEPLPVERSDKTKFQIALAHLDGTKPLVLVLMAVGLGPGNVIAQFQRRLDIT